MKLKARLEPQLDKFLQMMEDAERERLKKQKMRQDDSTLEDR